MSPRTQAARRGEKCTPLKPVQHGALLTWEQEGVVTAEAVVIMNDNTKNTQVRA